ncbi:transposase [Robbsia sp. Bb-Pol-6]|uniref:Transposase n=1 Tax=Robbsia betulipollinis TaxID=2981849 RepID=A0ABT3ZP57_9BURK|nr:transposase [Robbsia betulipollinis]MCY0388334.1 transposase [Robbsia betulipollinis]
MARLARLYVPGLPQYLMLDARPGQPAFRDEADLASFADTLRRVAREAGFAVHAYALLPSGVHLLGSPRDARSASQTVQAVGRRYVALYNRRHQCSGTLWVGRYRATVIDPEHHLLFVSRLIESLAATAMAATAVADLPRRSSHAHHVGLALDPLITDHALYWSLGNTPFERQRVYRELAEQPLDPAACARALEATRKGWVLGDDAFRERCARLANRRVEPLPRGRPAKIDDTAQ